MIAKLQFARMGWDGKTAIGLGACLSIGRRLETRDLTIGTISGFRIQLGLGFCLAQFICGVDPYRYREPELKFLRLEKL